MADYEEKLMPDSPHTADIVERLLRPWRSIPMGEIDAERAEAAAEIKALREVLEDIASTDRAFVDANGTDGAFMKIIGRARAALKDHRKVS